MRFWRVYAQEKRTTTWWTPKGDKTAHAKYTVVLHGEDEEEIRHKFDNLQGGNYVNLYDILKVREIFPLQGDVG